MLEQSRTNNMFVGRTRNEGKLEDIRRDSLRTSRRSRSNGGQTMKGQKGMEQDLCGKTHQGWSAKEK